MTGTTLATENSQQSYISQLPGTARELIDYIGLPATLSLVKAYGGQTFMVPKGKRVRGSARIAEIGQAIGPDAAQKLADAYGGEYLSVPVCTRALSAVRDERMRARFDALTSPAGARSARYAANEIAKEFGVTWGTVYRVMKRSPAA